MEGGDTARVVGVDVARGTDGGDTARVVVGGDVDRAIGGGTADAKGFDTVRDTFFESKTHEIQLSNNHEM